MSGVVYYSTFTVKKVSAYGAVRGGPNMLISARNPFSEN
jgi:hypothetical protein